jgi:hypothetical protein
MASPPGQDIPSDPKLFRDVLEFNHHPALHCKIYSPAPPRLRPSTIRRPIIAKMMDA